ncbi:class I SAM-dependent DNA methyltransferase [Siminovitchia sediminis]|uniref:Uncharacterized methyltransferase ACFSCZ_15550 n=1 Tax=Siminovitchia sediminis TaxID=1274353 RepID=A0ABW4KJ09_9BACI
MVQDFNHLFDAWSATYDETVGGGDNEYREVFLHYEQILEEVAKNSKGYIVEFGVGTGNLTEKLVRRGLQVYGIEPSKGMRVKATEKLPNIPIVKGDFLLFPPPEFKPDTIVSTYAFHHLKDEEKRAAIAKYSQMLGDSGKMVFADTVFLDEKAKQDMIKEAQKKKFYRLAADLKSEYYTTIPFLEEICKEYCFQVHFKRMNTFVWLMVAEKRRGSA